ncbi:MAG TPA: twin-arginine translocation signal domain-containing protein, partial [Chitinophagaceae bacterium]|nr:twin-arginine translocation signal domain-containing protein [Chitinophagaceae bacterium]
MSNRRKFIRNTGMATMALGLGFPSPSKGAPLEGGWSKGGPLEGVGKNVGIIGLDTSHSTAFTKFLNGPSAGADYFGFKVVAAYPWGSKTIKT